MPLLPHQTHTTVTKQHRVKQQLPPPPHPLTLPSSSQPHLLHACGTEHDTVSSTLCVAGEADVVAAAGQGRVVHHVVAAHSANLALQVHIRLQQVVVMGNLGCSFASIKLSLGCEAGCTLLDVCGNKAPGVGVG